MADKVLRVGTLNIQKRNRFPAKAQKIEDCVIAQHWDLLFMQECLFEEGSKILGLENVQDQLSYQASSVSRQVRGGLWMGNCILSRYPLTLIKTFGFQHAGGLSRRSALIASLDTGTHRFLLVALHLGLIEKERTLQISQILEYCHEEALHYSGLMIAGDFNDWSGQCHRRLSLWAHEQKSWPPLSSEDDISLKGLPATYPAAFPVLALDRVYAWGAWKVETLSCLKTPLISDHRALVANVRLGR
jgi:endonuclease/exonuclease/phosphatase family metal-dependent hydrolase